MNRTWVTSLAIAFVSIASIGTAHADLLVAKGAKATVTVEYSYVAVGMKKDKYDPKEWKVNRTASLKAQFEAQKPQELAQLRQAEAGQLADLQKKQATAVSAAKKMTPTMNDMMKIVEKCGENDEACIEREVTAYGNKMEITPELKSAGKDIESLGKTAGPRYQVWRVISQKGTYLVDEFYKGQTADPACMEKPGARCHREETRKGGGELTSPPSAKGAGPAMYEVDAQKKDIVMMLPAPFGPLKYSRVVKSDFPAETENDPSTTGMTGLGNLKPITIAIPGDLSKLSGTVQVKQDGAEGEGGMLTIRWTITTP